MGSVAVDEKKGAVRMKPEYRDAREQLLSMYLDYCKELDQYDSKTYPPGQAEKVFCGYESDKDTVIDMITVDDAPAGFLIRITPDTAGQELIIAEAYIKPEYRGKGWMTFAVDNMIYKMPLCHLVTLTTFNRNVKAFPYWEKALKKHGLELMAKEPIDEDCTEYYFTREIER